MYKNLPVVFFPELLPSQSIQRNLKNKERRHSGLIDDAVESAYLSFPSQWLIASPVFLHLVSIIHPKSQKLKRPREADDPHHVHFWQLAFCFCLQFKNRWKGASVSSRLLFPTLWRFCLRHWKLSTSECANKPKLSCKWLPNTNLCRNLFKGGFVSLKGGFVFFLVFRGIVWVWLEC